MKRRLGVIVIVGAALLLVIGGAMAFMLMRREPEWSSSSDVAVREFNAGLQAERKFYLNDALKNFERAHQLDPNFVMAKLKVAQRQGTDLATIKKMIEAVDQEKLNQRERFMIRYALANLNQRPETAEDILGSYLEENPHDAIGLAMRCARRWDSRKLDEAEKCYQHLLQVDPNWVSAQNNLGYIAMARGRFKEAEELFQTYRYIAPDQANPHDSLGELLTLVGRYDEAEKALNQALKVRPDFCASYFHLLTIAILEGDSDKGRQIMERARGAKCDPEYLEVGDCQLETFEHYTRGEWAEAARAATKEECLDKSSGAMIVGYAAALEAGQDEKAAQIEKAYRGLREKHIVPYEETGKDAILLHIEGVRLLSQDQMEPAIAKLREADQELVFWGDGQGIMKLYNRLLLAHALEEAGKEAEARQLRAQVKAVNPQVAAGMEIPEFD